MYQDHAYYVKCVISTFHCVITSSNHTARKFNLLICTYNKDTYLRLLNRINTSFTAEVISCYLFSIQN